MNMHKYQILYVDTDGVDLGISVDSDDNNSDIIKDKIKLLSKKWQEKLGFPEFELDMEEEDFMFPIKHKNYLYGTLKKDENGIKTKGNNFDAKNKPDVAVESMKKVVFEVLKDVGNWDLNDRDNVRDNIKRSVKEKLDKLLEDFGKIEDRDKLIMYENVSPAESYKDDASIYYTRTKAIEKLMNINITATTRIPMIVCKEPLPIVGGKLSNKGTKAIHYMYPEELVTDDMIDTDWYINNIRDYIIGAFGLNKKNNNNAKKENENKSTKTKEKKLDSDQMGVDSWFS